MGYMISAVFSSPVNDEEKESIVKDILENWPFLARPISQSDYEDHVQLFHDLNDRNYQTDDEYDLVMENTYLLEDSLCDWSKKYPEANFVYISLDCFGGTCLNRGTAVSNGEIIYKSEFSSESLEHLLNAVQIQITDGEFKPFIRGYFSI